MDKLKVIIGNKVRKVQQSGNYNTYEFKCPKCSYIWECTFYEDRSSVAMNDDGTDYAK